MKKFFSNIVASLLTPALVLGDYLTHQAGFLFIYSLLLYVSTIVLFLLLIGLGVAASEDTPKSNAQIVNFNRKWGSLQRAWGWLIGLTVLIYLSFTQHYWLAVVQFIGLILVALIQLVLASVAKREPSEAV